MGPFKVKVMTNVHVWYNLDCASFKLYAESKKFHLISHIRREPLDNKYLAYVINSLTKQSEDKALHVLVLSNRDVQLRSIDQLLKSVNLLYQITECRQNTKFICIDLLSGQSYIIKKIKKQLTDIASHNNEVQSLRNFGCRLSSDDFVSRTRLTSAGSKKVEEKLIRVITSIVRKNYF